MKEGESGSEQENERLNLLISLFPEDNLGPHGASPRGEEERSTLIQSPTVFLTMLMISQ